MTAGLVVEDVHRMQVRDLVRGLWLRLDIGAADPMSLFRGELPDPGVSAEIVRRGPAGDLVGMTWAALRLASARCLDAFRSLGLSGWDSLPVHGAGEVPRDLRLLVVTGRGGPAFSASQRPAPGVPPLGTFLDPRLWDGSDLFLADGLGEILIAPRRAAELRRARLRNVQIEPAALEALPVAP